MCFFLQNKEKEPSMRVLDGSEESATITEKATPGLY
jgi:hypothetical protein